MPQMLATLPPTIASMKTMRDFMVASHSTMAGIQAHMQEAAHGSTLMGKYFDEAKNDDSFYLPPEAFHNPDFQRGLKMFVSPDGNAVRLIITHQGDPASVGRHLSTSPASRTPSLTPSRQLRWKTLEGLARRHRIDVQRHAGGRHHRPVDRRHLRRSS